MTGFLILYSSRINSINRCKSLNKILKTKTRISMIYLAYSSPLVCHNNINRPLTKMLIHSILAWLSQLNSSRWIINSSSSSNLTFLEIFKTIIPLKYNNNSKMSYSSKFYSNLIFLKKNLLSKMVLRVQIVNLEVILMIKQRMQDLVEQWLEWANLKSALSNRRKVNLKL